MANTLDEVQRKLVREAMRTLEIEEPLEITTICEDPSGTGMGSSRSLSVVLLAAHHGDAHRLVSPSGPAVADSCS